MKSYRVPASFQKGRYVPSKVLGTGTYGQVIKCHDTTTGKEVAVKVAQSDAAYRRSALNEISALMALKENRDSVGILDSFEDAGHVCIVSELLDRNLFEVLRNRGFGPLSLNEVRQVAKHVLNALASLHHSGFIHCDIKPENIMLRCSEPASTANSPSLGPFASDGFNSSGCSNRSGEQQNSNNAFAPGQETTMADLNSNLNNQLWRNSNAIDSLVGNSHTSAFFESELNFGFSPRFGQKAMVRGSNNNGMQNSSSLDALFGTSPTSYNNNSNAGARNDTRVERNFPPSGDEAAERQRRTIAISPYCRTCLIDFGAVRRFNENTYYDVQSLWYRAPEVLCGLPYSTAIDSWSMGCVLFELFTGKPFFPGESPQQQLSLIVQHVGYPSQTALSVGCLSCQYDLPMVHVTPESRREHVRQWVRSCRETGLQRWRKHQLQKQQELAPQSCHGRSHYTADSSSTDDDDLVANGNPFDESDIDGTSEERELLIDLICELLNPDEAQRLSCTRAQQHPFLSATRCCNATPSPYTATPAACLGAASAVPQQMPCVMVTMPVAHPVVMATSPVGVQMGCSPVSPFIVHPVHTTAGSAMPYTTSQMDVMSSGFDMKCSSVGVPGMPQHQQPPPAFSTHPGAHNTTMYGAAASAMTHTLPMYTPVAHNASNSVMPLGVSAPSTGVYNSPASTGSLPQPTAMSMSPSFSSPTTFSQVHVPLGLSPVAMTGLNGGSGVNSMQPLGAPSYVLAANSTAPYANDYRAEATPVGMSPYVLCHFQHHPSCATVMSP